MVTLITAAFAVIAPVPCCAIVTVCGTSGLISDLRTTCSQCDCVAAGASAAETQRSCSSAPHQPALVECPFCRGTFRVWTDTSSSAGVTTAQRVVLLVAAVETLVDAGWRASPLAGMEKLGVALQDSRVAALHFSTRTANSTCGSHGTRRGDKWPRMRHIFSGRNYWYACSVPHSGCSLRALARLLITSEDGPGQVAD